VSSFQTLDSILPTGRIAVAEGPSSLGRRDVPARETLRECLSRIEHELLWPRILVRNAPPHGGIRPNAPDRPVKRSGRRAFTRV
jgi:hypothetical protein